MTLLVGYTREFFTDAGVSADAAALEEAGAELVFSDVAADVRARPELKRCLRSLEPGDVLVVTSAARLSHGVGHFVATTTDLAARGVSVRSLAEPALSTLQQPVPAEEVLAALEGLRRRLVSLSTRGCSWIFRASRRVRPDSETSLSVRLSTGCSRLPSLCLRCV